MIDNVAVDTIIIISTYNYRHCLLKYLPPGLNSPSFIDTKTSVGKYEQVNYCSQCEFISEGKEGPKSGPETGLYIQLNDSSFSSRLHSHKLNVNTAVHFLPRVEAKHVSLKIKVLPHIHNYVWAKT